MKLNVFPVLVVLATAGGFVACGGSVNGGGNNGATPDAGDTNADGGTVTPPTDDAGTPDTGPVDHGKPSATYPAFKVDGATLVNNGGDVLKNPVIVTVTWPGDTDAANLEAFGDAIGGTAYWKALVSEYGVGPAVSGAANHFRMTTAAPATLSDSDIDTLVANAAGAPATSGWPAPTDQTIYILYLHPSTSLQMQGSDACQSGIGGYHQSTQVNGKDVAYAVVPRCSFHGSLPFDESTSSGSHELAEAVTDPHPGGTPGYAGFDDNHLAYEFWQQFNSENGDACEFFRDSFYKEAAPFAYTVQRQWSNAASLAGHNPCVPAAPGAYFNVTPLTLDNVAVDLSRFGGSANSMTKGIAIKQGETKTFPVGLFSDAPTSGPWSLRASEGNPVLLQSQGGAPKTPRLKVSIDKTSGQNGEIAYVTVTVTAASTTTKSELLTVSSTLDGITHYMPILISSK